MINNVEKTSEILKKAYKITKLNDKRRPILNRRVSFHNLGCKVNSYETQAMVGMFEEKGYEIVDFSEPADICIINTCTVTNIADRKSRQMLHRAKKLNSDALVVAVGCYVQADPVKAAEDEYVDLVIGNIGKKDIVETVEMALAEKGYQIAVSDINKEKDIVYENINIAKPVEHTRAVIKVQDGCNQFCTYCLIPYVRGRIRSRTLDDVVAEVKKTAENGYKEVVITGIHISSYGRDFKDADINLLTLLKAIHQVEGIERIRLGSLEPGIIDEMFANELVKLYKICPHFHLSLQSGSVGVLKRMNRKYTPDEFYEKVCILRKVYDNPAITTDVIVGFPKESDEEFEETKEFLKKIRFYETHIFPYSKRKGTIAAEMDGQIINSVKAERSKILSELHNENSLSFRKSHIGKRVSALFEEQVKIDGEMYVVGHTTDYVKIAVAADQTLINNIVEVETLQLLNQEIILAKK